MPFACSITARRPNAPCRLWYSVKRCSVMSIALCSSSGVVVDDVGEDAALGRLVDVGGILRREQRDHRAGGLVDDLRDQLERVLGAEPEPDERDVGVLSRGHRADLAHVDLAGDHLVAEPGDDLSEQLEPVAPLVRDQDAEVLALNQPDWTGAPLARGRRQVPRRDPMPPVPA